MLMLSEFWMKIVNFSHDHSLGQRLLAEFPFTTSETELGSFQHRVSTRVASRVAKRLLSFSRGLLS